MCGIIGGVNGNDMARSLVDGLRRLEYRGYDSAGLAIVGEELAVRKASGPVDALALVLREAPAEGSIGIAHTRWATHGAPTATNAHPHVSGTVAVVHNGIVENHAGLRAMLEADGRVFTSTTDSEVIPHLIDRALNAGWGFVEACREAADQLRGRYAFVAVSTTRPDILVAIHGGSSLVLGQGPNGGWIASCETALVGRIERSVQLREGDLAVIGQRAIRVIDVTGTLYQPDWEAVAAISETGHRGSFDSHTRAEIEAQPAALARTLVDLANRDLPIFLRDADRADRRLWVFLLRGTVGQAVVRGTRGHRCRPGDRLRGADPSAAPHRSNGRHCCLAVR